MNQVQIEFYKSVARAHMRSLAYALEFSIDDDCDPTIIEVIDHYSALIKNDFRMIELSKQEEVKP